MESLLPDGTKRIELSKSQFADINKSLQLFYKRTKCPAIIVADASGTLIAKQGSMNPNNFALLSTLAAADYAATVEMSKIIGEQDGFKVHFHEGALHNLYLTTVKDSCYLIVVFSKETTFGMVRVLASKTIEELQRAFSRDTSGEDMQEINGVQEQMGLKGFQEELSTRLDSIMCK